jgi:hypothetical protein
LNADGKRTPTTRLRVLMMSKLKCIAVPVILFQLESRNRATTHFLRAPSSCHREDPNILFFSKNSRKGSTTRNLVVVLTTTTRQRQRLELHSKIESTTNSMTNIFITFPHIHIKMKFLVVASLLVSASAFSVGPSPNTQGASSTVSKLRFVIADEIFCAFSFSHLCCLTFYHYRIRFDRFCLPRKMVKSSLSESVPEDLLWPWHKPSKPEDAFRSNSKK